MDAEAGVMVTEGAITFSAVDAVRRPPHDAAIELEPAPTPAASPVLAIDAMPTADDVHVTELVTSNEVPLLYSKVAANCCCPPT